MRGNAGLVAFSQEAGAGPGRIEYKELLMIALPMEVLSRSTRAKPVELKIDTASNDIKSGQSTRSPFPISQSCNCFNRIWKGNMRGTNAQQSTIALPCGAMRGEDSTTYGG